MYCPQCGTEYRDGVTVCTECEVALVEEPPVPERDEAEWADFVTVLSTGDESEVRVAQSLLEAEGISCFANGERMQGVLGFGLAARLALGPVQVEVRPQDADAARALLAAEDLHYVEPDEPPEDYET